MSGANWHEPQDDLGNCGGRGRRIMLCNSCIQVITCVTQLFAFFCEYSTL